MNKRIIHGLMLVGLLIGMNLTLGLADLPPGPPYVQWSTMLGGSKTDYAHSIQQSSDGGYIVAGSSDSNDGRFTGRIGGFDIWVVKLNKKLKPTWIKNFGGQGNDMAYHITQTSDRGYVIAGESNSYDGDRTGPHQGGIDFWIVKIDSQGELVWEKSFGGTNDDRANSIIETNDGSYVIVGESNSDDKDFTTNLKKYNSWVIKLSAANGEPIWKIPLGGTGDDRLKSIAQTIDGGYIAAGSSDSPDITGHQGGEDLWIVKLTADGKMDNQRLLGGTNSDKANCIIETTAGTFLAAGSSESNDGNLKGKHHQGQEDFWVVEFDQSLNDIWSQCYGGTLNEYAMTILESSDGYVVAGTAESNDGNLAGVERHANGDYWIVKLDKKKFRIIRMIVEQRCIGGDLYDQAKQIWQNKNGQYVIAGHSQVTDNDHPGRTHDDFWIVQIGDNLLMVDSPGFDDRPFPPLPIQPNWRLSNNS